MSALVSSLCSRRPSLHPTPFVPPSLRAPLADSSCLNLLGRFHPSCVCVSLCFCSFVCMHACDFFTCVYVCTRDPSPTEMSVEPWGSPKDQAAAELTPSADTLLTQDLEQHPDKLCLDSFWSEVETIQQGSGYADLDSTRRDSRHSEGKYCKS